MNSKYTDYHFFMIQHLKFNTKELINKLYLEKNINSDYDKFYEEYSSICYEKLKLELWIEKTKFFKEFKRIMLSEFKKDFINKYGIEKYLIEEKNINKDIINKINKQKKMLLEWNN